jgi:hypothetical protein
MILRTARERGQTVDAAIFKLKAPSHDGATPSF